ncbi:flagellar hook-associated protein FlgK [Microbacterium sp. NPDC056044]|uniref:flagellar hook-associated protein FlgK n=1 Tax=Microbacterium sp. NPDC056044 TaxID=3345690 RepID=UPI0035D9B91C
MSTFSGISTAASALAAARRGMDVVGQNIANQNTEGYTRQRVTTHAVSVVQLGRFSTGVSAGNGVAVTGVVRLGDDVLDGRVRSAVAATGYWSTRALAATTAEAALAEPTADGLSARLSKFWSGWQDLANTPDSGAARAVLLESGKELAEHIASGYRAAATQWADARAGVDRTVEQVNAAAEQIAALNIDIRDALASGRSANELIDRRGVLAEDVAGMSGATATIETDGTMTLRLDGNALVAGGDARRLTASGPTSIEAGGRVSISWADAPGVTVSVAAGELGGTLSVLAPAGDGGMLAGLARTYNSLATTLADRVNAQHRAGSTSAGAPGGDFFALDTNGPPALGLSVAVGSASELALAAAGAGANDASNADALSQLGRGAGAPDALWTDAVMSFGVSTAADVQRARLSATTTATAVSARQAVSAVDGDEETISLMTYQTAYQAAARVLTAVDEALDVVINRMGMVGR